MGLFDTLARVTVVCHVQKHCSATMKCSRRICKILQKKTLWRTRWWERSYHMYKIKKG